MEDFLRLDFPEAKGCEQRVQVQVDSLGGNPKKHWAEWGIEVAKKKKQKQKGSE